MKFVYARDMQEIDRRTIEETGIPALILMENAGMKTVLAMNRIFENLEILEIVVAAGSGNNGGDGFVIARHLHNQGARVTVWVTAPREKLSPDARINLEIVERMGLTVQFILEQSDLPAFVRALQPARIVVDALFGTGLTGEVSGLRRDVISAINDSGTRVVSVDIPSGICADTGQILGIAVRAAATVTMGLPKAGLLLYPGAGYRGRLFVADIGFPRELLNSDEWSMSLIAEEQILSWLPERKKDTNKGSFGRVLIVGGSGRYPGALILTVLGCLQAGAGLITAASTRDCLDLVTQRLPEVVRKQLAADEDGRIEATELQQLLADEDSVNCILAIGPGLDRDERLAEAVRDKFCAAKQAVLDADGLYALIGHGLVQGGENKLITPHPGEAAALLGITVREIQSDRIAAAHRLVAEYGVNVLLKGAGTILASTTGEILLSRTGNSALAKGGTGDVLTGVIAAFMAQGCSAFTAGALAAWIHGRAGEDLSRENSEYSVRATQVAERIGGVLRDLRSRL